MEEAFNKLKREHTNDVNNLMNWIKNSQIIEATKEAEAKVLKLFEKVNDRDNVEFQKFKEIVAKIGEDTKKSAEDVTKQMIDSLPKLQEAFAAAAAAFQATMAKK